MFTILNKSERLIHAPNGEMLPPGVTVTVSEDTMNHPQMQALATEGILQVTEVQDPAPPVTTMGAAGQTQQTPPQPTPQPTPAPSKTS
jgi:hypothetical protein